MLLGGDKHARVSFVPSQRARSNVLEIDFSQYLVKGAGAKGKRVSTRVVRRVVESTERVLKERVNMSLPGMDSTDETSNENDTPQEIPSAE
jgi:topoisomerase-4 subunit A